MTIQTDIRIPKRHFKVLSKTEFVDQKFASAIQRAVDKLHGDAKDARVLNIGCGAGLNAMCALKSVRITPRRRERWLYLAMACKENLLSNGYSDDQVKVVYRAHRSRSV